jgi:hypothetical protein
MFNLEKKKDRMENDRNGGDDMKGFIKISLSDLEALEGGTFIKYKRKDGSMTKGGFFQKLFESGGHQYAAFTSPPKSKWNVRIENIEEIWKRCSDNKQKNEIFPKYDTKNLSEDTVIRLKVVEDLVQELNAKLNTLIIVVKQLNESI